MLFCFSCSILTNLSLSATTLLPLWIVKTDINYFRSHLSYLKSVSTNSGIGSISEQFYLGCRDSSVGKSTCRSSGRPQLPRPSTGALLASIGTCTFAKDRNIYTKIKIKINFIQIVLLSKNAFHFHFSNLRCLPVFPSPMYLVEFALSD